MEKNDGKKKYKGVIKSASSDNKMATKCLDITLTDEKILIKLNKLIKNKKQLDLSLSDSLNLIGPFATQNEYY